MTESEQIEKEFNVQDKCSGVTFSKNSGIYSESFNVTVSPSIDNNTIYCALGNENFTKVCKLIKNLIIYSIQIQSL